MLDGWTNEFNQSAPKPKDITICLSCGRVLKYTDELMLIEATADDIADCDFVELGQAQKTVKYLQQEKTWRGAIEGEKIKK